MTDEIVLERQVGCARCDGDGHDDMHFLPFQRPVVVPSDCHRGEEGDDTVFTHWALCPTTGEPILMTTVRDDDERWRAVEVSEAAEEQDCDEH